MVADTPQPTIHIVIDTGQAGERLDKALAALSPAHSRATLQRWLEAGRVTMDGLRASSKTKARPGAVVSIQPAPEPVAEAIPEAIPLQLLFEDEHLIVLDKPAGLVVHPAPGHPSGTLVNALVHHTKIEAGEDPRRPGVVHRLDKDTSGVMVVARTRAAHEGLAKLFARHEIERAYQAICVGQPPEQVTFDTLIGRHPTDRKRFSTRAPRGKRAITHVTRLRALGGATLVRCVLETGRTHQIRVHLADHGYPLVGDPVYGGKPRDAGVRSVGVRLARQALHARVLGFRHPISGEALRFETEPPADFLLAMASLEEPSARPT